jgi:hypothetical protein
MAKSPSKIHRWLLPAFLLVLARPASAAGKCEGQWHFELSSIVAESENLLPQGSWCQDNKLPKVIDVSFRYRAIGGIELSGSPYKPTDVMTAGDRCEFLFEGKASGLPEENELSIEVTDKVAVIRGSGRCSHANPRRPDGMRTGTSAAIAVSGAYSLVPVAPASNYDAVVASVLRACLERTPAPLWALMTPRFRAEVEPMAAAARRGLSEAELRKAYKYRGRREDFSGEVYFRQLVKGAGFSFEDPCADADQWTVGQTSDIPGGSMTIIHRPGGWTFGLKFVKENQRWRLDQMTKSVKPRGN